MRFDSWLDFGWVQQPNPKNLFSDKWLPTIHYYLFNSVVLVRFDSWLDLKVIGVVAAFDLVDNCLELVFIDFINNVTNKTIKYVNINVE